MMVLLSAVFVASVLGSMHCAGMCGAFLAFALNGADGQPPARGERARLQAAYHLGRLVSYTVLGTVAGGLGAALNLAGMLGGVSRVAMILAALTLIGFGTVSLLRLQGVKLRRVAPPKVLQRWAQRGHGAALMLQPRSRALTIGLLTTLLPCGWLYAFVVTAAGTASPWMGAATMAAFWFGTLPVMVGLGTGIQAATGSLGRRLPTLTCLLMIFAGVFTLAQRSTLDPAAIAAQVSGQMSEQMSEQATGESTDASGSDSTSGLNSPEPTIPDPTQTPACCAAD